MLFIYWIVVTFTWMLLGEKDDHVVHFGNIGTNSLSHRFL